MSALPRQHQLLNLPPMRKQMTQLHTLDLEGMSAWEWQGCTDGTSVLDYCRSIFDTISRLQQSQAFKAPGERCPPETKHVRPEDSLTSALRHLPTTLTTLSLESSPMPDECVVSLCALTALKQISMKSCNFSQCDMSRFSKLEVADLRWMLHGVTCLQRAPQSCCEHCPPASHLLMSLIMSCLWQAPVLLGP